MQDLAFRMITLYGFSQLCLMVGVTIMGIALLFIGNDKVRSTFWLRRAKLAVALVSLLVGLSIVIQHVLWLRNLPLEICNALNISILYIATLVISTSFIALAAATNLSKERLFATCVIFCGCLVLLWIAIPFNQLWTNVLTAVSLIIYFVELVRLTIVFLYNYRLLRKLDREPGSEDSARFACLSMVMRCVIALSSLAVLYVLLALLSVSDTTVFNFALIAIWVYMFISFVNLVIDYNPLAEANYHLRVKRRAAHDVQERHMTLLPKIESWVDHGGYKTLGVTMLQVAEQLGTNRTYLSEYINVNYGCSFNTWLGRLRVAEAKRLMLSSPTLSLDRVALNVGFSSKSHFMSTFKSIEGETPGRWRERNLLAR